MYIKKVAQVGAQGYKWPDCAASYAAVAGNVSGREGVKMTRECRVHWKWTVQIISQGQRRTDDCLWLLIEHLEGTWLHSSLDKI